MDFLRLSHRLHAYCIFWKSKNRRSGFVGCVGCSIGFAYFAYCNTSVSTFTKKMASTIRIIGFTTFAPPFAKKRVPI